MIVTVCLIFFTLVGVLGWWHCTHAKISTHTRVLSYYGYTTIEQMKALKYLLNQSGILKDKEELNDLFPRKNNKQDRLRDILNFVKATQSQFVRKTGFQEWWEIGSAQWMQETQANEINRKKTLAAFKTLGFLAKVDPSIKMVDAICILGSTMEDMSIRLVDADKLLRDNNIEARHVILLAGERKVASIKNAKITINTAEDGTEQQLLDIVKEYNVNGLDNVTETHLIQKAYQFYQYSESSPLSKLTLHVIDTPAGNLPRPTTETTVIELLRQLKKEYAMNNIKTIAFISNQPYVKYQEAVIKTVLDQQNSDLNFEVVGPNARDSIDIKSAAGACGAHIFAKTPSVLHALGISQIKDEKLKEEFLDLYKQNPLIYKHIQKL